MSNNLEMINLIKYNFKRKGDEILQKKDIMKKIIID